MLDVIKEKGYTHEQVIEYLEQMENSNESEEEEEEEEPEDEDIEDEPEEDNTDNNEDDNDEPKMIQLSKEQLIKLIKQGIEESKKAKLKAPSKRKTKNTGTPKRPVRTRDEQFEVMF